MPEHKSITLREVAKRAGVSIATVSRVLNKTSFVSPEIKESVRDAVRELGYYQNSIARSLKTNSSMMIGFVTANISNPYMITVARAIEEQISGLHYSLLVCSTESDVHKEHDYLKLLLSRGIDGLVLNGTGFNEDFVAEMSRRIPVILLHRRYKLPENRSDLVDSDNETGTYGLTRHLLSFGHRKIFVIKGTGQTSSNIERFQGFRKAMMEYSIPVEEDYPYQFEGNFGADSGLHAVEHLNSLPDRPTAILGLNNTMTLGAMGALRACNYSVPEDISIASYNNIDNRELMTIRPAVHDVNPTEVGLAAGIALRERLQHPEIDIPNREFIIGGRLVPGNAVSIPPASVTLDPAAPRQRDAGLNRSAHP